MSDDPKTEEVRLAVLGKIKEAADRTNNAEELLLLARAFELLAY